MKEKTNEQEWQTRKIQLEDEAAKWLTEKLHYDEDNASDYPAAAQRALFVRGIMDRLADKVDHMLNQAVIEYFHGSNFADQIKKTIMAEAIRRFPNKDTFAESFPDIKGKLIENKEV